MSKIKKCLKCDKVYKAIRETSTYCSTKCRVSASRIVTDSVTKPSVTEKSSVSVTSDKPLAKEGFCHACQSVVDPIICICRPCVESGKSHEDIDILCPDYEATRMPSGKIRT